MITLILYMRNIEDQKANSDPRSHILVGEGVVGVKSSPDPQVFPSHLA